GAGQTKFGELWDRSLRSLGVEAGLGAIKDAKLEKGDIQSLFVGNMSAGRFVGQEHLGALLADGMQMRVPATRCEAACASGSVAFRDAYFSVASGDVDVALVVGVEKMTDVHGSGALTTLAAAGDQEWEASIGLTFAGLYALMARKHMHDFGTTSEQMASVAVTNHRNGLKNKLAQFQMAVTLEDALTSTLIADPLRLFDCSPITDGAAAVVITSENVAKKLDVQPIYILGSGQGSDTIALHSRASYTELLATKAAAKKAYEQAGVTHKNISVTEVHDCFTINEIIALEDLGFVAKGKGGKFVEGGAIDLNGEIPTNTCGGLKVCGHPVGATGVRQIGEIVKLLRGTCFNPVNGAEIGLNLNIGGSGATAVVNIFGKEPIKR
ncbi:MAG: thiolase domain-containing protein, partial [Candidatus Aenigmarchaeota archaeon]|nr:thiolase domain-containing protein [Candidatus Aenigmarchaeota archaeon]